MNQSVSIARVRSILRPMVVMAFWRCVRGDFGVMLRLVVGALDSGSGTCHAGIRSRKNTHGRMKYRGSTRGAVMSEREVVRSQRRMVDVGGEAEDVEFGSSRVPRALEELVFIVLDLVFLFFSGEGDLAVLFPARRFQTSQRERVYAPTSR